MKEKDTKLIPANVMLAGRSYRLLVEPEDEAFVRAAVKRVNEQIAELRSHYAAKDEQDFVAMCLLMHATEKKSLTAGALLEQELTDMAAQIEKALNE
ncbi:MAG: cell division protein ZapA [Bacteroidetes bacterium]|nr:cell division protein ZapA [Bacteroidota bacterium]